MLDKSAVGVKVAVIPVVNPVIVRSTSVPQAFSAIVDVPTVVVVFDTTKAIVPEASGNVYVLFAERVAGIMSPVKEPFVSSCVGEIIFVDPVVWMFALVLIWHVPGQDVGVMKNVFDGVVPAPICTIQFQPIL